MSCDVGEVTERLENELCSVEGVCIYIDYFCAVLAFFYVSCKKYDDPISFQLKIKFGICKQHHSFVYAHFDPPCLIKQTVPVKLTGIEV